MLAGFSFNYMSIKYEDLTKVNGSLLLVNAFCLFHTLSMVL
jgi:hypothetical protein